MENKDLLKYGAIIGAGGVAVWALVRAAKFKDTADKLTVNITRFDIATKGMEYLKFLLDLEFVNPSSQVISISIPSIKPYYNRNELGYSVPMKDSKAIQPKSITKISKIEIRVPFQNLITAGIITDILSSLKNLQALVESLKQKTTFKIYAIVNGLEVSIEQKFGGEANELGYIPSFTDSGRPKPLASDEVSEGKDDALGGIFEGIGLVAAGKRNIKDGSKYNHLILKPDGSNDIVQNDGSVEDTVLWCGWVVKQYHKDTEQLAKYLKEQSKDDKELYKNIFDFCYNHIQYRLDRRGIEQLRRPATTWRDRKAGVDCDDYTIFIASILYNLGKPFEFRITKYSKPNYQHIYLIVPMSGGEYVTIDPVLDTFNYEKPYSYKKDFDMKQLNLPSRQTGLAGAEDLGIPIEILAGEKTDNDLLKVILGEDLQDTINGLGSAEDDADAMLHYLKRLRNSYVKNPDYIKDFQDPEQAVEMLDYAIKNWDNPLTREKALEILAKKEDELINTGEIVLSGIDDDDDESSFDESSEDKWEDDNEFTGIEPELAGYDYKYSDNADDSSYADASEDEWEEDIGFTGTEPEEEGYEYKFEDPEWEEDFGYTGNEPEDDEFEYDYSFDGLGGRRRRRRRRRKAKRRARRKTRKRARRAKRRARRKKKGGVFKRLARGVKRGFKAVAKGILKVSAAPARLALLTALRTNVGKVSDKLKYGYLTEQQAVAKGIDRNEYRKLKKVHGKIANLFKKMGGSSRVLRKAILSGKRKHLRGFEELNGALHGIDELDGFEMDLGFTGTEPENPEFEYKYDDQVWETDLDFTGVEPEDDEFNYDYTFDGLEGRRNRFRKRKRRRFRFRRHKRRIKNRINRSQANKLLAKVLLWVKDIDPKKVETIVDKHERKLAFLKALSYNYRNLSTILSYGYASEGEVSQESIDTDTWNKIKLALSSTVRLFKKELGGSEKELKKAILLGENKPALSGLGAAGAVAAAGSVSGLIGKIIGWLKNIKIRRKAKRQAKSQIVDSGGSKKDWRKSGRKRFTQQWQTQKAAQAPPQEEIITTIPGTDFSPLISSHLKSESASSYSPQSFTIPTSNSHNIVPVNYSPGQSNVKENAVKAFLKKHKKKLLIGGGILGLGTLAYLMLKPKKKAPVKKKPAISGTGTRGRKKRNTNTKKIKEITLK